MAEILSVDFIHGFKDSYLRNNRTSGQKSLRCFPQCCERGHVASGFCGSSLQIVMRIRKCPWLKPDWENREISIIGQIHPISEAGLSSQRSISRAFLMAGLRNSNGSKGTRTTGELFLGRVVVMEEQPDGVALLRVEFNGDRHSWDYSWKSNRWSGESNAHVVDIILIQSLFSSTLNVNPIPGGRIDDELVVYSSAHGGTFAVISSHKSPNLKKKLAAAANSSNNNTITYHTNIYNNPSSSSSSLQPHTSIVMNNYHHHHHLNPTPPIISTVTGTKSISNKGKQSYNKQAAELQSSVVPYIQVQSNFNNTLKTTSSTSNISHKSYLLTSNLNINNNNNTIGYINTSNTANSLNNPVGANNINLSSHYTTSTDNYLLNNKESVTQNQSNKSILYVPLADNCEYSLLILLFNIKTSKMILLFFYHNFKSHVLKMIDKSYYFIFRILYFSNTLLLLFITLAVYNR